MGVGNPREGQQNKVRLQNFLPACTSLGRQMPSCGGKDDLRESKLGTEYKIKGTFQAVVSVVKAPDV